MQAHFYSTKCCWFRLENAKALYSLNKRVNKLLRWELFLEQLNGIEACTELNTFVLLESTAHTFGLRFNRFDIEFPTDLLYLFTNHNFQAVAFFTFHQNFIVME